MQAKAIPESTHGTAETGDATKAATPMSSPEADKPVSDADLILLEPLKADRSKPVTFMSYNVPSPVANFVHDISDLGSRVRFQVLHALPGFIVNNSSNAIGVTQLAGEALYFKSSGVNKFVKDEHRGTWKAFVYPPVNIVEGVFKKSAFHIDAKRLLNPKYVGTEVKRFFDLKQAAEIDLARDGKLSNRWSARSGFAGMTSMTIAALFPDEKDDPEVTEKMIRMKADHPIGYVGYRLGKGLMFPVMAPLHLVQKVMSPEENHHIGDGKREFAGIGMTLTGFFSVLAGCRQPRVLGTEAKYGFNMWQALGGAITTYAGTQLLTGVDHQQGWTNYGKTQFGRLLVLPMSIKERFPDKNGWGDPNARYYFGAQGVFQFKNVVASLIGGAQRLPDGRIIDQKKHRLQTQAEVKAAQVERKYALGKDSADILMDQGSSQNADASAEQTANMVPTTHVSSGVVERAMPERVAQNAVM